MQMMKESSPYITQIPISHLQILYHALSFGAVKGSLKFKKSVKLISYMELFYFIFYNKIIWKRRFELRSELSYKSFNRSFYLFYLCFFFSSKHQEYNNIIMLQIQEINTYCDYQH
jgi:hypothetical protein